MITIIWLNSLLPARISSEQSGFVTDILISIFGWIGIVLNQSLLSTMVRKIAHFLEFFVLGFLFFNVPLNIRKDKNLLYTIFLGLVVAIIDECIQLFVDGRAFMFTDIGIDMLGVIVGGLVGLFIFTLLRRKSENKT